MHLLWLYYTAIVKERTSALIYCVAIVDLAVIDMKLRYKIVQIA